jgi:polysaccharide pyruvyl transferase WcaK-like protein
LQYFLYGYYGHGNFGDDILLQALVEGIRARDADAKFLVYSLNTVPGLASDAGVHFTGVARYVQNLRARPWRLGIYVAQLVHWLTRSDVLVIGGGTLFIDKGRFNFSLALLYTAGLFAKLIGKRVVIVGVGIDRLTHPVSRWLTNGILSNADFVAVREALGLPYVANRRADQTRLAADLALGLNALAAMPRAAKRSRQTVGLCFIDYYRTVEPSEAEHAAYKTAILRFIESCRRTRDVCWITFQRSIGQRDDWLIPALHAQYPDIAVHHVDSMEAAAEMAEAVDILVTTRFHLGILGAMWGKPVIVIDHELKMTSLASDFALPSASLAAFVNGEGVDLDSLLRGYDAQRTAGCLAIQRGRVAENFTWLVA